MQVWEVPLQLLVPCTCCFGRCRPTATGGSCQLSLLDGFTEHTRIADSSTDSTLPFALQDFGPNVFHSIERIVLCSLPRCQPSSYRHDLW